jgi:hypothetical protein
MEHTETEALAAFEAALARLDASPREPGAWIEHNLLEALVHITSGQHDFALACIAAAGRPPTPPEASSLSRRELLTKTEIRDRLEDLRSERK